ncbi:MAG TPA: ABC transporter permease [Candidatus Solibacter sp.]|nr:ABC transporter permease [Candidatus Solibacter sp.]
MDLLRRIHYLFHRSEYSAELDEEMKLHQDLRAQQLRERGLGKEDARFAARREFGNRAAIEIASSDVWGWGWWERLAQDLRYAVRSLRNAPGFVAIAVLTLAVGVGMNTAVFSIVNAVVLRSLPYPEPERLVAMWEMQAPRTPAPSAGATSAAAMAAQRTTVSPANLMDYRAGAPAFEGLAGVDTVAMNLTGAGAPERILGESVTANYFAILGVDPEIGRVFTEEEDREGATAVVVLAHRFWERRFGADRSMLGQTITFDAKPYRVIGVMPGRLQPFTQYGSTSPIEYFVPAAYPKSLLANHGDHEIKVIGRLKPGASRQTAQAQLDAVSASLALQHPDTNRSTTTATALLREDIVQNVRDGLTALLAASALIVLITCVNVANLLLVRAAGRRHETSVRLALGAGRWRMIRTILTESFLVSAAGCVAGVALGSVLMRVLVAAAPQSIPRLDSASMDVRVFLVAATIATITGLVFGLAPAWNAARTSPADSLKTSERTGGSKSQTRWRDALTITEVALSLVLIIGAGLSLRSFQTIMGMDLGFQTDRVMAMNITLPDLRYATADQRLAFFQDLESRTRAMPGVQSVAFANRFPLRGGWGTGIEIEGLSLTRISPDSQAVSPGYFETLGLTLLRGRLLTQGDRNGQPYVAMVNQAFARQYLNGQDAIGHRFRRNPKAMWFTIVGVVNDIRRAGKMQEITPQIYLPAAQTDGYPVRLADFAVRTQGEPHSVLKSVQQQVWAIDKDQPITNVRTMSEIVSRSVAEQRFQMLLLTVFAVVAMILATIGVFGVLSYAVNQRMNEIGVRIALGASPSRILGLVLKQAGALIVSGATLGLAGAWMLTRFVSHLLFQVQPHDAATYATAVAVLVVVALIAALVPARRGARVDPLVALRYE